MNPRLPACAALLAFTAGACAPYHLAQSDAPVRAAFGDVLSAYADRESLVTPLLDTLGDGACAVRQPRGICGAPLSALRAAALRIGTADEGPALVDDAAAFHRFETGERQLADALAPVLDGIDKDKRLSADPALRRLRIRFAVAEDGIAASRSRYDQAVRQYNTAFNGAPGGLAARFDKPAFTIPDHASARLTTRTDFGALKGTLVV